MADVEKGTNTNSHSLIVLPPRAHIDRRTEDMVYGTRLPSHPSSTEDAIPSSNASTLSLPPKLEQFTKKATPVPPAKSSRWILFQLWFNTYRKFFTFVTLLNLAGIIMAVLGRFSYAANHRGALVLGNLLFAILMRNELFIRFLYLVAIYGLRSVRLFLKQ